MLSCPLFFGNMCRMKRDKLLLLIDLEGMIGFSERASFQQNWEQAKQELEILLKRLQAGGIREFSACVVHNDGTGFPKELLTRYDLQLFESASSLKQAVEGVRCAILLGFHGMANTGGVFDHTFRMDVLDLEYDQRHLGEVGIFTHWLAQKGIRTLMVSGEGNFVAELEGIECLIHRVPPELDDPAQMEQVRGELADMALLAIQAWDKPLLPETPDSGPLVLQVDNPDKYALLAELPYLRAEADRFLFPDLDSFINHLNAFAIRLNQAANQIAEKNLLMVQRLRELGPEESLRGKIEAFLRRDFFTLSSADRLAIAELTGIDYEGL